MKCSPVVLLPLLQMRGEKTQEKEKPNVIIIYADLSDMVI
jgi:hypothetical protein